MRRLVLSFLLIPSIAFAAPRHHAAPKPAPSPPSEAGPSRQDLLKTVDHIVVLSQDLQRNLENEKTAHEATEIELIKGTKANADLQRQIDGQTRDFNTLKDKYASQSKKLSWYRWHWWGSWIVFGLGILAVGFLAFLKFTGRLAVFGTAVAAKIP